MAVVRHLVLALSAALCMAEPLSVRLPHRQPIPDYNAYFEPEAPLSLGAITSASVTAANQVDIACGRDLLRVQFWRTDVVRIWLAWNGNFTDEATADIVTGSPSTAVKANLTDKGTYYEISATDGTMVEDTIPSVVLHAKKAPLTFSMYSGAGALLWAEAAPLSRNASATFQSLLPAATAAPSSGSQPTDSTPEAFFGGGMQNGRFAHAGSKIRISNDFNWADGGNPNAVPFYASSRGYAVYRNTWAPGWYDFGTDDIGAGAVVSAHNETDRFDAFYFAGPAPKDWKGLLRAYTYLVGVPFMPPIYALGLGYVCLFASFHFAICFR